MSLSTYVSNTLSVLLPFQKNPMLDKFSLSQIGAFSLFQRKSTLSGSDLISLCTQQGLAGNEKWRKGWLTLTLPICTFHPPPLSIDLSVQNIFQSDLAGFSFLDGWTWKRGIYLVWNPSTEVVFWIVRGEKKRAFTWVSQFRLITWSEINGLVWTRAK